jgi:hypothetical protein
MSFDGPPQVPETPKPDKPRWFKSWAWTGASFLGAGGLGFILLTEFRSGPILAMLAGLGAYYVLAFHLPQALSRGEGGDSARQLQFADTADPRVELLVEAHQHIASLAVARAHMPMAAMANVNALHDHAKAITALVSAQPEKLNPVLRFFTYYLPSTADLVMDRIKLAPHAGDARLAEIDQTLARLVEAFAGFEAAVRAPDLESVDLDVTLLDQALDADLDGLKR